jgi:hypothetical protein
VKIGVRIEGSQRAGRRMSRAVTVQANMTRWLPTKRRGSDALEAEAEVLRD